MRLSSVSLVYVVKQFPKTSETFVLREVRELLRRGVDLTVWSLMTPDAGEPAPTDADDALRATRYVPAGRARLAAFARAALSTDPRRLLPAVGWALAWSVHEREWRVLGALPYAVWLARRIPPGAHVHAHFANVPATVALLVARLRGTSWSFTGHANDIVVSTSRRFLGHKVRAARAAVVGTEFARAHVREAAGGDGARVVLVRNGLEAAELEPAPVNGRAPRTVVCVGRLVEKKGVDTLVEAAALLRDRGEPADVRVVGDGPLREELERLVAARGVEERVRLLGARTAPEVRDELARATAFALPCRIASSGDVDSGPLAIVEAMAQRTPVVTTPVGGIAEVVHDGESGLLVAPDDPQALAAALSRVLGDAELRDRLAAGGRAVAERDALEPNVDRLLDVFAGR